jgi:hypothetical protein
MAGSKYYGLNTCITSMEMGAKELQNYGGLKEQRT